MTLHSQNCVITNNFSFFWYGIENPITICTKTDSCKSLIVTTNNGKIKPNGLSDSCCSYLYTPEYYSSTTIFVFKKVNNDSVLIKKELFFIHPLPLPWAYIAGIRDMGTVNHNILKISKSIYASETNVNIDIHYKVESYTIFIIRNGNVIFFKDIIGSELTDDILKEIDSSNPDDRYIFTNIRVKLPFYNNHLVTINSVELKIK